MSWSRKRMYKEWLFVIADNKSKQIVISSCRAIIKLNKLHKMLITIVDRCSENSRALNKRFSGFHVINSR